MAQPRRGSSSCRRAAGSTPAASAPRCEETIRAIWAGSPWVISATDASRRNETGRSVRRTGPAGGLVPLGEPPAAGGPGRFAVHTGTEPVPLVVEPLHGLRGEVDRER